MDGALQRWERVHFQCYSDLAGQGLVGVESSQGRLVVILKVIVRVRLILEILWFKGSLSALKYLEGSHWGNPLHPLSLRLWTGLQLPLGQGWEQGALFLIRTYNIGQASQAVTFSGWSGERFPSALFWLASPKKEARPWICTMRCNYCKGFSKTLSLLETPSLEAWQVSERKQAAN